MLDRTRPPVFSQTFKLSIPQAVSDKHGHTPFHWINAGEQPVFKIEIIFRQGGSFYDQHPGTAFITNKMLTYGTLERNHSEIVNAFEQYGSFVKVNPSFDDPTLEVYGLNKHAEKVLPILADVIHHSIFPEREFDLVKNISIEQLNIQNARNGVQASKLFRSSLFGAENPYGTIMTPEDLQTLSQGMVRNFFSQHYKGYEVLTTGRLDGPVKELIEKELGEGGEIVLNDSFTRPENIIKEYVAKDNSLQSSLRIGKLMPHRSHQDYIPLLICIHALGGYFGSRLMKNIREDKGYTYGIYASLVPLRHTSYLVIGGDVQKANRQDAIDEVFFEIRRLKEELIPESELQMVRNHLLGSIQSDLSSPFSLAEKFKAVHLFGLDYSYYDRLIEMIQRITSNEIRDIAIKYLDEQSLTEVSVG